MVKVFAISDLHLGANVEKPMDVFGPEWRNHEKRIVNNWLDKVSDEDLVLLPGDLSWAMKLDQADADLELVRLLPGRKFFIRGNHDFWLSSPSKVRSRLGENFELIRFDARAFGGIGVCGIRGWPWPGYFEYNEDRDESYYKKELKRLRLSLESLSRLDWEVACAMIHYPPLTSRGESEFCSLLREAGVRYVAYGHIHGQENNHQLIEGEVDGMFYFCVSADLIGFSPQLLFEYHNH